MSRRITVPFLLAAAAGLVGAGCGGVEDEGFNPWSGAKAEDEPIRSGMMIEYSYRYLEDRDEVLSIDLSPGVNNVIDIINDRQISPLVEYVASVVPNSWVWNVDDSPDKPSLDHCQTTSSFRLAQECVVFAASIFELLGVNEKDDVTDDKNHTDTRHRRFDGKVLRFVISPGPLHGVDKPKLSIQFPKK